MAPESWPAWAEMSEEERGLGFRGFGFRGFLSFMQAESPRDVPNANKHNRIQQGTQLPRSMHSQMLCRSGAEI